MAQQNRTTLKTYFETGDTPTEAQFIDTLDSTLLREDVNTIAELNTIVADATILVSGGDAGTPSAVVLTNATGTAADLTAGNVTTNANMTGHVTSAGSNATVLGSFTVAQLNTAVSDATLVSTTGAADVSAYVGLMGLNSGAAVDVNTKALLEARLSDVADIAEADGDTYTGTHDFGGADDLEIPNSATPTVDTDGQVAIDTTVADFSHGIMKYFSGEEMAVVAMPIAELTTPTGGTLVSYNATNDEFELVAQAGGGDMSASTYDAATISEQLVGLTATQSLSNKTIAAPVLSGTVTGTYTLGGTPTFPATVVSTTGTQTLTNKTITDPKVAVTTNAQTGTTYTLVLTDASKFITMGNATSNAFTIPPNSSVAFAVGTVIAFQLIGAGTGTIIGGAGVTLNGVSTGTGTLTAKWSGASIIKTATDTWSVIGDIGTVV